MPALKLFVDPQNSLLIWQGLSTRWCILESVPSCNTPNDPLWGGAEVLASAEYHSPLHFDVGLCGSFLAPHAAMDVYYVDG